MWSAFQKETYEWFTIELLLEGGSVCPVTHGRKTFLTERTLSTRDLETGNNTITRLYIGDFRADFLDNTHPLVTKNVTLFELHNLLVVQTGHFLRSFPTRLSRKQPTVNRIHKLWYR